MANFNYNNVQIGGKVTRNIELKQTSGGKNVCHFTVAVNRTVGRDEEKKADFFDCEAWDSKAEFISKFFRKGSSIFVTGELRKDDWTDKDGNYKSTFKVRVKEVDFVDSKAESEQLETTQDEPTDIEIIKALPQLGGMKYRPNEEIISADDALPF